MQSAMLYEGVPTTTFTVDMIIIDYSSNHDHVVSSNTIRNAGDNSLLSAPLTV